MFGLVAAGAGGTAASTGNVSRNTRQAEDLMIFAFARNSDGKKVG